MYFFNPTRPKSAFYNHFCKSVMGSIKSGFLHAVAISAFLQYFFICLLYHLHSLSFFLRILTEYWAEFELCTFINFCISYAIGILLIPVSLLLCLLAGVSFVVSFRVRICRLFLPKYLLQAHANILHSNDNTKYSIVCAFEPLQKQQTDDDGPHWRKKSTKTLKTNWKL